jgi:hypothetical protein
MTPLDIALACWLAACVIAGLLQLAAPGGLASRSAWGNAPGWQREIALWNFALCVGIVYARASHDALGKLLLGRIIAILSLFLGLNHLAAARHRPTLTHTVGAAANGLGLALMVWALLAP